MCKTTFNFTGRFAIVDGERLNSTMNKNTTILAAAAALAAAMGAALTANAGDVTYIGPTGEPIRWGASASNWEPARIPTADDRAVVRSAALYLGSGDAHTVSNAAIANAANASAKITINAGASLSFASAGATSIFADSSGATSEIDVDGGSLSFAGKVQFSDAGAGSTIRVRNNGTLDLGADAVFGKNAPFYAGATRLFVTSGGSVLQNSAGVLFFGDGNKWNGAQGAGGEIEINGGTLVAGNQIVMQSAGYSGNTGKAIIRLKEGSLTFSGSDKSLTFWGGLTNALFQSGGSYTGNLSFQGAVLASGDSLIELSGGTNAVSDLRFGTESGNNDGRLHMRIIGREVVVKIGKGNFNSSYSTNNLSSPPIFMEFVVDSTTRRDSTYPVTPVYVTVNRYDGGYGVIRGVHHVRPAGGAQLVHQNYFPMYVKAHDGWIDGHGYDAIESTDSQHGFRRIGYGNCGQWRTVGSDMWTTEFAVVAKNEILGTSGYVWQMRQTLKTEAAFVDGAAALATPVARGWLALPALAAKDIRDMKRASVRLALVPGTGETLESLVAGFRANGYPGSVVELKGIYNVRLDIPVERLVAGVATDRVLFDFAEFPNYNAAKNDTPTVRATISAVKWDPKIGEDATVMVMR